MLDIRVNGDAFSQATIRLTAVVDSCNLKAGAGVLDVEVAGGELSGLVANYQGDSAAGAGIGSEYSDNTSVTIITFDDAASELDDYIAKACSDAGAN